MEKGDGKGVERMKGKQNRTGESRTEGKMTDRKEEKRKEPIEGSKDRRRARVTAAWRLTLSQPTQKILRDRFKLSSTRTLATACLPGQTRYARKSPRRHARQRTPGVTTARLGTTSP